MTTSLYFLSLVWASRLFPTYMNQETYTRYWMAMERTRDQGSGTRATKNQKLKTKNQKPKKT